MFRKPSGESPSQKVALKSYSNMRFEAEDLSKISYFQDDKRWEATWRANALIAQFFLFYDFKMYSCFDTGRQERRAIDFLTDISQRHKPFEQGVLEYGRRIFFYETVMNQYFSIIHPEKLSEFERNLNRNYDGPTPIPIFMAANELGNVSYCQQILNWQLSLLEFDSQEHQCLVSITSYDLNHPTANITLFLKPAEFQKVLSVIQLYGAIGTPLNLNLLIESPAYQGILETIFLDYRQASDKHNSSVGLGFPAAIFPFSFSPLTAEGAR